MWACQMGHTNAVALYCKIYSASLLCLNCLYNTIQYNTIYNTIQYSNNTIQFTTQSNTTVNIDTPLVGLLLLFVCSFVLMGCILHFLELLLSYFFFFHAYVTIIMKNAVFIVSRDRRMPTMKNRESYSCL